MQLRRVRRSLLAVALLALVGGGAPRAAPADKGERAARAAFQRGEKAFNLGKFDEALKGYEEAYEAKPLPALLFNIAQCHRNLGDAERAVFFYRRFLALDPETPNRAMVEQLIVEQQKVLEERAASATPTPAPAVTSAAPAPAASVSAVDLTPRPAPGEAPPLYRRWWVWAAAGVVAAGVAAALLIEREGPRPRGSLGGIDFK
jgi:tetratricopeptide (TPR) repeat protein